jgi:hypothetical protein
MKTCSLRESDAVGPDQLAAMVAFIPVLEAPGFCPGGIIPMEEDGLPQEAFTNVVSRFMDACYKNGMVVRFDWESWEEDARGYMAESARLQQAGLQELRRLLTWHVRQNRFAKDHLARMMAQGHILAILKRMGDVGGIDLVDVTG